MLRRTAESSPNPGEHGERNFDLPTEHVPHLGRVVQHLVHADADEVDEHQFGDGPHPGGSGADRCANESRLGQWRVQHPLVPELLDEADGGPERAAPSIDDAQVLPASATCNFLAHDDYCFVAFHLLANGLVDGLAVLYFPGGRCGRHPSLLGVGDLFLKETRFRDRV